MTGKADFTPEEWDSILEAPISAGMIVVTAGHGGTFKETLAIGKAYGDARKEHGQSELLDEIVNTKPKVDHTRYHDFAELKLHGLQHVRDAVDALTRKATPEEVDGYRRFVLAVSQRVAEAHREDGVAVSGNEQSALDEISTSLGATAS
jgi:hypothetical protein